MAYRKSFKRRFRSYGFKRRSFSKRRGKRIRGIRVTRGGIRI